MTPRPAQPVPDAAFDRLADALRSEGIADAAGPAGGRKVFGADALKVGGRIFAMAAQGTLVLKLPAARVDALIAEGRGARFDPGHGRLMKEWVALAAGRVDDWPALAREARAFVAGSAAPNRGARRPAP